MSRYILKRAMNGQYMFNLTGDNGEIILTSETYASKAGAESGIASVRLNSPLDSRYDRRTGTGSQPYYFILKGGNGEVIGRSEMYSSSNAREVGIASVKKNGPIAPVSDQAAAS
jgi:uncharacterized protein YegP (UPF0339 family)